MRLLSVALAGVVGVAPMAAAHRVCTLQDDRINEASGIAVGIRDPDVFYIQNDSGDRPRVFAVDRSSGKTRAVIRVPGANNVDWEDIAVARDPAGTPSVWIADTGDNEAERDEVQIYRVDEPAAGDDVGTPDVWRLRYPGGPDNAEAMLVVPDGSAIYLVTKSLVGAEVYAAPTQPDSSAVHTLQHVASLDIGPVTGGTVSSDGRFIALRTYTTAYVWRLRGNDVPASLRAAPTSVELPRQPLGEGIATSGRQLLVDSEHVGTGIFSLRIPRLVSSTASPEPGTTPSVRPDAAKNVFDKRGVRVATTIGAVALAGSAIVLLLSVARLHRRRS